MKIVAPILITAYLVLGVIFSVLAHDSQPTILKEKKWLGNITQIILPFVWIPYLIVNLVVGRFVRIDIWFRLKTDD